MVTTNTSADLELMRASLLLESQPAVAARLAAAILAQAPGYDPAHLLFAAACRRLGDATGAIATLESLVAAHPHSALMQLELGRTYALAGRTRNAIEALTRAVALDATLADAWRELSAQQWLADDIAAADAAYQVYDRLAADPPQLKDAYAALESNRLEGARTLVQQRLLNVPDDVTALRLLAAVSARLGDEGLTEVTLQRVLLLAPCCTPAREQWVHLLLRQGRIDAALPELATLLLAQPTNRTFLVLQAEALRLAGRHAEGLALVTALIARHPDDPYLWLIAGNQHRFSGAPGAAVDAYRQAIELRPHYGEAYWALSNLKTFRFDAMDAGHMRDHLASAAASGPDLTHLEFALGRALEDDGQYSGAFEHYARANARVRSTFHYDARATTAYVRRFQATFTRDFFAARTHWGSTAMDPIFIVGLPRSGSTLLEQILASHPAVEGTRELADMPTLTRELAAQATAARSSYPGSIAALAPAQVAVLAARYLDGTRAARPLGRPRFVDKMLGNFVNLGLIAVLFPEACIIDCRRHPMACGWSCYTQLFNPGMDFAYDLTELGLYCRDFADLMEHMAHVLPGRVHRVQYEELIADPEPAVRRLLDYCRLPFDAACLRPHETARVAQTISSEQVRRPMYADAIDHWRHFEPWLDPLRRGLG